MEEIKEQLDNHIQQINIIKNFIALSLRREKVESTCVNIQRNSEKLSKLLETQHELMQEELENVQVQYEVLMRRMRLQQSTLIDHLLSERRRKLQAEAAEERSVQRVLNAHSLQVPAFPSSHPASACKALNHNFAKMSLKKQQHCITPKMSICDYKASPLVKRSKIIPIPFGFLEFELQITPQQFDSIPKYMRGRETLDELNNFLESIIIPCFNEKYQLMHRQRNAVRNQHDIDLWRIYNEQTSYVPGRNFITPGDISRRNNKMIDKKMQNRISMLRHIGVLQEQRVSQTVCYIWSANTM